jgi:BlaI family transcriptional regulator, penicillinase repressor
MKTLTKAEEQIMQVIWQLERAFVKEIITELPEPKPAYNTVSTVVRILESKGVLDHESFGKSHRYFPTMSKEEYTRSSMNSLVENYFDGSFSEVVSFFVKENKLDLNELNDILETIQKNREDRP